MRNTWVICLEARDNSEKSELIPDVISDWHQLLLEVGDSKGLTLPDKPAAYQLVGGVTAHQG